MMPILIIYPPVSRLWKPCLWPLILFPSWQQFLRNFPGEISAYLEAQSLQSNPKILGPPENAGAECISVAIRLHSQIAFHQTGSTSSTLAARPKQAQELRDHGKVLGHQDLIEALGLAS